MRLRKVKNIPVHGRISEVENIVARMRSKSAHLGRLLFDFAGIPPK